MRFPIEKLKPVRAEFSSKVGFEEFIIEFSDFSLPDSSEVDEAALKFENPIRADSSDLSILPDDPVKLKGKKISFPANPHNGHIDASVYFASVHNPVDITQMEFGSYEEGKISVTITSRWLMSFEGTGFEDFDFIFTVPFFIQRSPKKSLLQCLLSWFRKNS